MQEVCPIIVHQHKPARRGHPHELHAARPACARYRLRNRRRRSEALVRFAQQPAHGRQLVPRVRVVVSLHLGARRGVEQHESIWARLE